MRGFVGVCVGFWWAGWGVVKIVDDAMERREWDVGDEQCGWW